MLSIEQIKRKDEMKKKQENQFHVKAKAELYIQTASW